jgi:NADH-quinone oxidoreductase subunit N
MSVEAAVLVPALILLVTGAFLIVARRISRAYIVAWMGLIGSTAACVRLWEHRLSAWGWVESDPVGRFLSLLILVGVALTLPISRAASERDVSSDARPSTDYGFVLLSAAGMLLAVSTRNLLVVFAAIEMVWYALSLLSGRKELTRYPTVLASVSILIGLGMFRVGLGSFDMAGVEAVLVSRDSGIGLLPVLALGFFVVGIFLKLVPPLLRLGAVGVPVALTAQIALFGALLRMRGWLLVLADAFEVVLAVIALVSMFAGNLWALRRNELQGVLSSSFLVHIGFLALGVAAGGEEGRAAVIFYLLALVMMGMGAWSAAVALGSSDAVDWRGRGRLYPYRGIAMSIFLFSMAGVPLTMGFVGRIFLVSVSVRAIHISLVAVALLNLLVCFYYYMKVVLDLFAETPSMNDVGVKAGKGLTVALVVCTFVVLAIGVWPDPFLERVKQVAMEFF